MAEVLCTKLEDGTMLMESEEFSAPVRVAKIGEAFYCRGLQADAEKVAAPMHERGAKVFIVATDKRS